MNAPPRIHCLGAGGMGVAPLALFLAGLGHAVSGEDDAMPAEVASLLAAGGVALGPLPEGCDLLVYSSAIGESHPARRAATARGLPQMRRGELLARVVRDRRLVAVCGAHGKTTTTAMLVTALRRAGVPAGYLVGGLFADGSPPASTGSAQAAGLPGSAPWVVAEIDESDGTIDGFAPEIAVIVNLDWDHPDHYQRASDFEAAFAALAARTRGAVLVSADCEQSRRIAPGALTFGRAGDFSASIADESAAGLTLALGGRFGSGAASVRAQGDFNAANATAALAAARLMGVEAVAGLLADYPGVRRRQTVAGEEGGVLAIEDYAHHPGEIRPLLAGLRKRAGPGGRLVVLFQPHRFSRTARFLADFAAALAGADAVHLLDVYPAGEEPVPGGTTADLYRAMRVSGPARAGAEKPEPATMRADVPSAAITSDAPTAANASTNIPLANRVVRYWPGSGEASLAAVANFVRTGDVVAFVGAGDVDRLARAWPAALRAARARRLRWDEWVERARPLLSAGAELKREEPLGARTTLRVGGTARTYAEPADEGDLRVLLREAAAAGWPVWMLGRGSNLIVSDEGVEGVVVALGRDSWSRFEPLPDGRVRVGAGLRLKRLCGLAGAQGLPGFEFLEGIPGNVGGALRMNAGAMGGWIFDVVDELRFMTRDGEVRTRPRAELHAGYRRCAELEDGIALDAVLRASSVAPAAAPADRSAGSAGTTGTIGVSGSADSPASAALAVSPSEAVARQIDVYRRKRRESQPREPSAGCIFKNPPGASAGQLIDAAGLKGARVGDAEVSSIHANFIVNRGEATSDDVLELIRRVRARVREARGIELEPEVLLYGRDWKDVL